MSRPIKWTSRVVAFLAIAFVLMLSGVFDPLAESLKYTLTNALNALPTDKPEPYPDRVENSYFTVYVALNMLAASVAVFVCVTLIGLARSS